MNKREQGALAESRRVKEMSERDCCTNRDAIQLLSQLLTDDCASDLMRVRIQSLQLSGAVAAAAVVFQRELDSVANFSLLPMIEWLI